MRLGYHLALEESICRRVWVMDVNGVADRHLVALPLIHAPSLRRPLIMPPAAPRGSQSWSLRYGPRANQEGRCFAEELLAKFSFDVLCRVADCRETSPKVNPFTTPTPSEAGSTAAVPGAAEATKNTERPLLEPSQFSVLPQPGGGAPPAAVAGKQTTTNRFFRRRDARTPPARSQPCQLRQMSGVQRNLPRAQTSHLLSRRRVPHCQQRGRAAGNEGRRKQRAQFSPPGAGRTGGGPIRRGTFRGPATPLRAPSSVRGRPRSHAYPARNPRARRIWTGKIAAHPRRRGWA